LAVPDARESTRISTWGPRLTAVKLMEARNNAQRKVSTQLELLALSESDHCSSNVSPDGIPTFSMEYLPGIKRALAKEQYQHLHLASLSSNLPSTRCLTGILPTFDRHGPEPDLWSRPYRSSKLPEDSLIPYYPPSFWDTRQDRLNGKVDGCCENWN
jgi:hypothetical protein